jgi:hypothetical protein
MSAVATSGRHDDVVELTILMPCLNEAGTLPTCIRKAQDFCSGEGINAEILVADNGSTDGSQNTARACGAQVVEIPERGYGAALQGGIDSARGRYVIVGDADDSYDFAKLDGFLARLRDGADLVMGNRFRGGIAPGAMPMLHRYFGNPVLSWIGRLFFRASVGDFHCGLRGFRRDRIVALGLQTVGMEFASEMVVRSALAGYRIDEVPTRLQPDGRDRSPHLRTWRDGWRHLSFLLMYSPKWLFLYPGLLLTAIGTVAALALLPGAVEVGGVGFDIHTFTVGCTAVLIGVQAITFAIVARRFATSHNLIPPSQRFSGLLDMLTLERVLVAAGIVGTAGIIGVAWCVLEWAATGFGPLEYASLLRRLIVSLTCIAIGIQFAFTAFLSAITEIPVRRVRK